MRSLFSIRAGMFRVSTVVAVVLWIAAVGMGARTLLRYANTPARATSPPGNWPTDTRIRSAPGHPILLVFAHPECPCTRATLAELALMIAQLGASRDSVASYVLFSAPSTLLDGWDKSGLWQSAVS